MNFSALSLSLAAFEKVAFGLWRVNDSIMLFYVGTGSYLAHWKVNYMTDFSTREGLHVLKFLTLIKNPYIGLYVFWSILSSPPPIQMFVKKQTESCLFFYFFVQLAHCTKTKMSGIQLYQEIGLFFSSSWLGCFVFLTIFLSENHYITGMLLFFQLINTVFFCEWP